MESRSETSIGGRIRRLRLERKKKNPKQYSLQEMANRLGSVSKQMLSFIERGRIKQPGPLVLSKIAADLGVTVDFLISGVEGNKDSYLKAKAVFLDSIRQGRAKLGAVDHSDSKTVFLLKKTGNLLDLLELLAECMKHPVPDNYDLYTKNLSVLTEFIDLVSRLASGGLAAPGPDILLDQAFWGMGKLLRNVAVQIDEAGGRHIYAGELQSIACLAAGLLDKFGQDHGAAPEKTVDLDLQGARLTFWYPAWLVVPEQFWDEFKKRIVFEWELMMLKIKRVDHNN